MRFFRDTSINIKVLIPPVIVLLALGVVSLLAVTGLDKQRALLKEVQKITLDRITLVKELILVSEKLHSDLFRISVLRFMDLPDKEIRPVHGQLEQGLNDLKVLYGRILKKWPLDPEEKTILEQMKIPMDDFQQQARDSVAVVFDNPSFGILLVRSASLPFADFRGRLTEFMDFQKAKIRRTETLSNQKADMIRKTIIAVAILTALIAILATVLIGTLLISRPIRFITDVMGRLAEGRLSVEVGDLNRRDEIGSMTRAVEVFREGAIEKQVAEEALKASEANYRTIFDSANDAIFIHDLDTGQILDVNRKMCEVYGYTSEETRHIDVGTISEGTSPYSQKEAMEWIQKAAEGFPQIFEWKCKRKTGEIFWVEVNLKRITIGNEDRLLAIVRDTNERKRNEEQRIKLQGQLQQVQKIEALGILAGGIAHDLNNLLAAILGNIELSMLNAEPGSKRDENLSEAKKASIQAKDLARRFVTFSSGGDPHKKIASMVEIVRNSTTLSLSGSNVKTEFFVPDDLWPVQFDEGQIKQVVGNLAMNAREAMPEGGVLTVTGKNVMLHSGDISNLSEGKYVRVSIEDKGVGIPEGLLDKIFDPYFSTKEMGAQKGMGLGLSICYSIILKHGGHMGVKSKTGVGTNVFFYLPASDSPIHNGEPSSISDPDRAETNSVSPVPHSAIRRILVMDDEEMIRDLMGQILARAGYDTAFARDGAEAIDLYKKAMESGQPFDLVFLDLTIKGGMGGMEAVKQLLEIDPHTRAVISTGYFNDPVLARHKEYGFLSAMTKPFTMKEVYRTIEAAMNGTPG